MDCILIEGLRIFAFHGVNDEEKRDGQHFLFDVMLTVDLTKPGESDDVNDTVSYAKAAKLIARTVQNTRFDLLERLAAELCTQLFSAFSSVQHIRLAIRKPEIRIADLQFQAVGIQIERERP